MKNITNRIVVGVGLVALSLPAISLASTTTYQFGELLAGSYKSTAAFAQLLVSSTDNKTFTFDLKANDLNQIFTNGAFLTALSVNDSQTGQLADPIASSVMLAAGTWGVSSVGLKESASGPGGSKTWDFDFTYPTAGNNGGAQRLTANEEVKWTATFSNKITFNSPAFALHVQGLTKDQGDNAWYTSTVTAVPEPETYTMLGLGLGIVGAIARKRKSRQSIV